MRKLSKQALRLGAIVVGACVVVLFILSQEIPGAEQLNGISKVVEWSGMVFLPLFGLNLDLYSVRAARIAGLLMVMIHVIVIMWSYRFLPALTYISITPIAVAEIFVLVIPFLRIRTRLESRR